MSSKELRQTCSSDAHLDASSCDSDDSSFQHMEIYDMKPLPSLDTRISSQTTSEDTRETTYQETLEPQRYKPRFDRSETKERLDEVRDASDAYFFGEPQVRKGRRRDQKLTKAESPSHYRTSRGELLSTHAMQRRWYCLGGILFSIGMVLLMGAIRIMYPRIPVVSLHSAKGGVVRIDLSTDPETFIVELSSLFSIDNRQWFMPITLTNMEFIAINMEYSNDPILTLNDPTIVEVPARSRKAFLSQARISTRDLAALKNFPAALDCAEKYMESLHPQPETQPRGCTLHVRTKFESHYLGFKLSDHELNYDINLGQGYA